jgi:HTH-type transcriptional regulator, competence development regulator
MKPFGEFIRDQRVSKGLLLREVAAELEIDPSMLSRIERGDKRPTRKLVVALASVLKENQNAFLVHYLSERVVYELKDEKLASRAIQAAEKKIAYLRKKQGKAQNQRSME